MERYAEKAIEQFIEGIQNIWLRVYFTRQLYKWKYRIKMALLEFHELLIRDCIAISGPMEVKRIHNPLKLNAYIFTYVLSFAHKFHRALEFFKGLCGLSRKKKQLNMLTCYQKFQSFMEKCCVDSNILIQLLQSIQDEDCELLFLLNGNCHS